MWPKNYMKNCIWLTSIVDYLTKFTSLTKVQLDKNREVIKKHWAHDVIFGKYKKIISYYLK